MINKKVSMSTNVLALCALFSAITAILSQISIPLGPIPLNLATFSVFLSGGLLGAKYGSISQLVYLFIGAVGIPVFANFKGGIGVLAGPTGGYIIGYIIAAFVTGWLVNKLKFNLLFIMLSMTCGLFCCYMLGTVWYMIQSKQSFINSLMVCVFPFLIGDGIKIIASAFSVRYLKKFINMS